MQAAAEKHGRFAVRRFVVMLLVCGIAVATASAESESPQRSGVTNVTVHMTEYHFRLSQTSAPVGTVVFTVVNDGTEVHNFSIAGKTTPDIQAGASARLSVNFASAGSQP